MIKYFTIEDLLKHYLQKKFHILGKYASEIMAFPTTILVDRNGNIVGEPMLGGIDNKDNYDALMKQIQSVIDADSTNK